jgi:pimeloyl-ACP methyl ester carboxylesterase
MKKLIVLSLASACLICAQAPASKQVEVFGQKIHYLEAGSGPNVILLHGLGADANNWVMNTAALAKSFHVFVPDQIGFGESDKPPINYRVGTLVDFLDGFYKKVGITKATVVGNSLGGWTAIAFTLAHPDKVERMVLVDSAGYSFKKLGQPQPTIETMDGLNPSTVAGSKAVLALILANKSLWPPIRRENSCWPRTSGAETATPSSDSLSPVHRGEDVVDGKLGAIKSSDIDRLGAGGRSHPFGRRAAVRDRNRRMRNWWFWIIAATFLSSNVQRRSMEHC